MITVLGSINIDLTTVANEIPRIGETMIGLSFNRYPGGKGANQAVCAAKLNTNVMFLGKVGNDDYGSFMLGEMENNGVNVSRIERCETSTGIAAISVDIKGQNSIIVVPGANFNVDCAYIDKNKDVIKNCDLICAQHETPIEATEYAFDMAKSYDKTTILNPAPAANITKQLLSLADILVPNEHELSRIAGTSCNTPEEVSEAAHVLMDQGAKTIIVTMGKEGVMLFSQDTEQIFPAFKVRAIDTTAAGDSFVGGFAAMFSKTRDLNRSIDYGQKVASYSIQHEGAQSSMPTYEQFEVYLRNLR